MSKLCYLLDEHVSHAIQSQLLRLDADIDVLVVGQPGHLRKAQETESFCCGSRKQIIFYSHGKPPNDT